MQARAVLWITLWAAAASRVGGDGDDDSGGGVGYPQEDERFERLYEKLELLNALEADGGVEEAAAAERSERQLEMVAALAAAAPRLGAEQLEELLTDLRDATAAADDDDSASAVAAAAAAADGAGADYADDDWHEIEDDYPMDDEEGAGEAADVEEEAWSEPPLEGDADTASEEERLRRAALAHWKRVMRGASCAEPTPRVLCAQDVHPHAGKIYLPQCAVLHRCGREAGCCHDAALQCAPLHRHVRVVYLPFYVLTVESSTNSQERLPFVNHTRCGCVNRTTAAEAEEAERAALRGARASVPRSRPAPPPARRRDVAGVDTTPAGAGMPRDDDSTAPPRAGLPRVVAAPAQSAGDRDPVTRGPPEYTRRCSCPRGFTATSAGATEVAGAALEVVGEGQGRGECRCECRERDCARLSKGKEHFGLRDRLCVKRAQCAAPRCEFGPYNRALGRCPRRRDPPPPPPPHTAHHRFTSRLL